MSCVLSVPSNPSFSVLVADGDANRRLSVVALLARGIDVIQVRDGRTAWRALRNRRPAVILLAADLPELPPARMLQKLKQRPELQGVAIILTCPASADRTELNRLAAIGNVDVLVLPTTPMMLHGKINDALERTPGATASLAAISARFADASAGTQVQTPSGIAVATCVEQNPALVKRPVQCPACDSRQNLSRFSLRKGAVHTLVSSFDIPVYVGPVKPHGPYCNHHLLHITVCPSCFFASGDSGLFPQFGASDPADPLLDARTRQALAADADHRGQLMWTFRESFFTHRRSVREALVSYQLAEMTARVMHQSDPARYANELARMANYHLRAAQLMVWDLHCRPVPFRLDEREPLPPLAREQVQHAYARLRQAYAVIRGLPLFKTLYQLVATSLYVGDQETAIRALSTLTDMTEAVGDDPVFAGPAKRYARMAERAWRRRDQQGPLAA